MVLIDITIKGTSEMKLALSIDNDSTVLDLKRQIELQLQTPALQQKLIFQGRILKDDLTLESYGVVNGVTVHYVKGQPAQTASTPTTQAPTPNTQPNVQSTRAPPMAMNPSNQMSQMMSNPMFRATLDHLSQNPEEFSRMISSNPQIQSLIRDNPQLSAAFNNPEFIRSSLQLMRDPAELMRRQELMLSQIENSGHFLELQGQFERMMDAFNQNPTTNPQFPALLNQPSNTTANSSGGSFPNPWSSSSLPMFDLSRLPRPSQPPTTGSSVPFTSSVSVSSSAAVDTSMSNSTSASSPVNTTSNNQSSGNAVPMYDRQLEQLRDMGFLFNENEAEVRDLLRACNGNINVVVERLISRQTK